MNYSVKRSTRNNNLFVVATSDGYETEQEFSFKEGALVLHEVKDQAREATPWVATIKPIQKSRFDVQQVIAEQQAEQYLRPEPSAQSEDTETEFFAKCEAHDWFYTFSDATGVWKAGQEEREQLKSLAKGNELRTQILEAWELHTANLINGVESTEPVLADFSLQHKLTRDEMEDRINDAVDAYQGQMTTDIPLFKLS